MKEYTIEIICRGGKPYITRIYKTYEECLRHLDEMVELERKRRRPYFVELEDYENEYNNTVFGIYFRVFERDVTGWEKRNTIVKEKINYNNKVVKIY